MVVTLDTFFSGFPYSNIFITVYFFRILSISNIFLKQMSSNGTCFCDGLFKEKKQHGNLSRDTKSYREHFVRLKKKYHGQFVLFQIVS